MRILMIALAAACLPAAAQEIKLPPSLERLAAQAEESVDVSLDRNMLRLTARFLSDKSSDEARVKHLISGLEGVYVRSFQFAQEGDYDPKDLDEMRRQLKGPDWSRIVGVKSKSSGDDVDVYLKATAGGNFGGVVIIAAERLSLTVVSVVGTIAPEDVADLGGQFHIPKLDLGEAFGRRRGAR